MTGYRERIYRNYASQFQAAPAVFDRATAQRWGKGYEYYLRGWLPRDKRAAVADLACGGGQLLYFLQRRGYEALSGADISPEQVRIARGVCPAVAQSDVLDYLAAHPGAFDLITGLDIIEHFHKEEALVFLDRCHAALKPGGRLIVQTPNAGSPMGGGLRYGDFTHETGFNAHSLTRLLELCGFAAVEAREMGPVPWGYSLASSVRYALWRILRVGIGFYNRVETGSAGDGICTRVFLASGVKKP